MKYRRSAPHSTTRARGALGAALLAALGAAIAIGGCPGPDPRDAASGGGESARATGPGGSQTEPTSSGGVGGSGGESTSTSENGGGSLDAGCDAAKGCCDDTLTDPDNCGHCGFRCSSAHTLMRACVAGKCVPTCAPGWADLVPVAPNGTDNGCETPVRRVFVTQETVTLPLPNGLLGGDNICMMEAQQAMLGPTSVWRAWLSDSAEQKSPLQWPHLWQGAYVLVNGNLVAMTLSAMIAGPLTQLQNAIDIDPTGVPITADGLAWTGTSATGMPTGADCNGWGGGGASGPTVGTIHATSLSWTNDSVPVVMCSTTNVRLYCFEQEQ